MKNTLALNFVNLLIFFCVDIFICFFSLWLAFSFRLDFFYYPTYNFYFHGVLSSFFLLLFFIIGNNYNVIFKDYGIKDLKKLFQLLFFFSIFFFTLILSINYKLDIRYFARPSISIALMQLIFIFFFVICIRIMILILINFSLLKKRFNNIAIYGAGDAGIQLANLLKNNSENLVKYFIDDNKSLHNTYINFTKIISYENFLQKFKKDNIKKIFFAIPSIKNEKKLVLFNKIQSINLPIKTLPNINDIIKNFDLDSQITNIKIEDLLSRNIYFNEDKIKDGLKDKIVLVTGAGGSIGSEICKQIINYQVKALILLDNTELNLFNVENIILNTLKKAGSKIIIKSYLVSAVNTRKINEIFKLNNIDIVFHAAAYKHVSLLEENFFECFQNNLLSVVTIVNASHYFKVKKVISISTDKAVYPSNCMGISKRLGEIYIEYFLQLNKSNTIFSNVRFGNVLGSSGSVVPIFQQQINSGGPLTVTDPNVTRFFMTIHEAVKLILELSTLEVQGNYYLDMGDPVKILDLAKKMIDLSGYNTKSQTYQSRKIEIVFTGLKKGEKLHEELSYSEGYKTLQNQNILLDPHRMIIDREYQEQLEKIINLINDQNKEELIKSIKNIKLF